MLDKLFNENRLLKIRFDKLENIYQRWIDDERFYLLKRIEKLENENHQFYEIYQTYEKSLQSITNLIIKILLIQQVNFRHIITFNKFSCLCLRKYSSVLLFSLEKYTNKCLADLITNISYCLIYTCLSYIHFFFLSANMKRIRDFFFFYVLFLICYKTKKKKVMIIIDK